MYLSRLPPSTPPKIQAPRHGTSMTAWTSRNTARSWNSPTLCAVLCKARTLASTCRHAISSLRQIVAIPISSKGHRHLNFRATVMQSLAAGRISVEEEFCPKFIDFAPRTCRTSCLPTSTSLLAHRTWLSKLDSLSLQIASQTCDATP